jgi:hypothetical protein
MQPLLCLDVWDNFGDQSLVESLILQSSVTSAILAPLGPCTADLAGVPACYQEPCLDLHHLTVHGPASYSACAGTAASKRRVGDSAKAQRAKKEKPMAAVSSCADLTSFSCSDTASGNDTSSSPGRRCGGGLVCCMHAGHYHAVLTVLQHWPPVVNAPVLFQDSPFAMTGVLCLSITLYCRGSWQPTRLKLVDTVW